MGVLVLSAHLAPNHRRSPSFRKPASISTPSSSLPLSSYNHERILSGFSSASLPINDAHRKNGVVKCKAVGSDSQDSLQRTVYQGTYGPWSVESSDVLEVVLYRMGLVTAATSFVLAASSAFLPEYNVLKDILRNNADLFYATGAGGLGLSLFLIHIYVTPIKRFLQLLWATGTIGSLGTYLALAHPESQSLVEYVLINPGAVWLVGPLFASLTGLVFKEGLCYGKLEAGLLTFVIPTLLLGHLSGLMGDDVKLGLLGVWMALFVIFAGRKFTQPIKDDIGDKSVFMFNALPEEERQALLKKLENPGE
ncbi:integral membrane family protein [Wolffia australiana]